MKMSPRLTNVARITACTVLLISYARAEPLRERVFQVEEISYIECRENRFDVRDFKNFTYTANVRLKLRISQNRK